MVDDEVHLLLRGPIRPFFDSRRLSTRGYGAHRCQRWHRPAHGCADPGCHRRLLKTLHLQRQSVMPGQRAIMALAPSRVSPTPSRTAILRISSMSCAVIIPGNFTTVEIFRNTPDS